MGPGLRAVRTRSLHAVVCVDAGRRHVPGCDPTNALVAPRCGAREDGTPPDPVLNGTGLSSSAAETDRARSCTVTGRSGLVRDGGAPRSGGGRPPDRTVPPPVPVSPDGADRDLRGGHAPPADPMDRSPARPSHPVLHARVRDWS